LAELHISSERVTTLSTPGKLFQFLTNFENFKSILPEDKVENFEFTSEQCSFDIRGITKLTISIQEKTEATQIVYISKGLMKFDFTLDVQFYETPASAGEAIITMFADLNPFIKSMAEKPLRQLVESMANKLAKLQLT